MERKVNRVGYKRVAEALSEKIEAGVYPVGDSLPSQRKIAAEFEVSDNVARDALYSLRDAGIIEITGGIGSTVLMKPSEVPKAPDLGAAIRLLGEVQAEVRSHREEIAELRGQVAGIRSQLEAGSVQPGSPRPRQPKQQPAS